MSPPSFSSVPSRPLFRRKVFSWALPLLSVCFVGAASPAEPLPGTQPLEATGDLSAKMVEGIGHWLEQEDARVAAQRSAAWQNAAQDRATWEPFAAARREELRKILGLVDQRKPGPLETVDALGTQPVEGGIWSASHVRWPVFAGVYGEGVLYRPATPPQGIILLLPDADETPERAPHATELAARGWLVLVPVLVDRRDTWSGSEAMQRFTNQPHREWLYRQAFEMGRTIIGYEAQKIFAALDALSAKSSPWSAASSRVGIIGYGEGGLLALTCAALDERCQAALVAGYFGSHADYYHEPIYRNVFGERRNFGNAELAALMAPRPLFIDPGRLPHVVGPPTGGPNRKGAAPGRLGYISTDTPTGQENFIPTSAGGIDREKNRADAVLHKLGAPGIQIESTLNHGAPNTLAMLTAALHGSPPPAAKPITSAMPDLPLEFQNERQHRTVRELEAFTQGLIDVEERERTAAIWSKVKPGADWDATQHVLRERLWRDSIGKIEAPFLPSNPRSRLLFEKEKFRAYEVTLDVLPDVYAWGWLLVPRDLKPGERRPVVVCQHGLEGLPEDVVTDDPKAPSYHFYKGFATQLADQGFIVYAPHNPYRGQDHFRILQRRANPLGLSLFSFILAQHDVTTKWLAELPFVDPQHIGFYGLSYGGKSAMRLPALLDRYCLSICSGDFNEWIRKVVSPEYRGSYLFTGEYEMPEWNLANTANYAEMAMLIAPRPFMVERGHDDGVGMDEWVGYEFAKVKRGYDKLGLGDRTAIEWFDGPHTIRGVGTFEFLHQHLAWPPAK